MEIITLNGRVAGSYSWTTGFKRVPVTQKMRTCEEDVLAHALYLERHGRHEEAQEFLECALARLSRKIKNLRDSFSACE